MLKAAQACSRLSTKSNRHFSTDEKVGLETLITMSYPNKPKTIDSRERKLSTEVGRDQRVWMIVNSHQAQKPAHQA